MPAIILCTADYGVLTDVFQLFIEYLIKEPIGNFTFGLMILRVVKEGTVQAFLELSNNKLRTLLSLLGITIGIWCVISVLSSIDSLETSIRGSFDKLGQNVLYVQKADWGQDPNVNFWRLMRRPSPDFTDFRAIERNSRYADQVSFSVFLGSRLAEFNNNSVQGGFVIAVTMDYADLYSLDFDRGRYFSFSEFHYGSPVCILGYSLAKELFGQADPIGQSIKTMGRKVEVIGVLEAAGTDLFNPVNFDEAIMISYPFAARVTSIRRTESVFGNTTINVKPVTGVSTEQLSQEVTQILRNHRRLKPVQENNFAINEISIISNLLDNVFPVISLAGWIIGGFSIIVGVFSVANIMFVSVKERTRFIGIKKALGARRSTILLEFLIEAIMLCLLGGCVGLLMVYFTNFGISAVAGWEVFLSWKNLFIGLFTSFITGIIAGLLPAWQAARLDPVDAIRA